MTRLPKGTVTFMFTDIEGSTRLLERLGDTAYSTLLERHHRVIRSALHENHGVEVATEGDSFFAVFTDPVAASRAAGGIVSSLAKESWEGHVEVLVRIGIHTGTAVVTGDDYVGVDVNRASRVSAAAHGGQILLSSTTARLVEGGLPAELTLKDLGEVYLAGLTQPDRLSQLSVDGVPGSFPKPRTAWLSPLGRAPLLERSSLLNTLEGWVEKARRGEGTFVLVAGEAGSGKTSLSRGLIRSVEKDTLVLEGGCDPLTTPRPLSPLYDIATDSDAGLADLMTKDRELMEVFGEVLERLRTGIRPVLMLIEDIHWADDATLDLLRFIGRRVADTRSVVVCTYRDDEVGADHPLRPVLGQLIPLPSTERLIVPPLTKDAVATLADGLHDDPDQLHSITGGNAFYVTEVLAAGESLPATVQDAVLARVTALEPGPRQIVEAVSIAPRVLDIDRATNLVGADLEDVDQAVSAGMLMGDGRDLRFRHELARSAVEDSLEPGRRLGLHRRMLDLLEDDDPPDLARLAHHAIKAEMSDLVLEHAPSAARDASKRGAHKEAVAFYQAALRHSERIDDDAEAAMRAELANELGIVNRRAEAWENVDRAVDHYRRSGNEAALAATLIPDTGARWRFEDPPRFRRALDEALDILEARDPGPDLARAYLASAYQFMLARKGNEAARDVAKAKATAEETGADQIMWTIRMLEGTIPVVVGDSDLGVQTLQEVASDAAEADNYDNATLALMMLGSGGGEVRRYSDAIPALERAVERGLLIDQDYLVSYSRAWLGRIAFEQGRWDDAAGYVSLVDQDNRTSIGFLTAMSVLGRIRLRRGDPGGLQILEEMVELGRSHELQHGWNAICGRAEHFWLTGTPETALDALSPAYERALETTSLWARGEVGFWMWKAGAIEGPPDHAAEPFRLQMEGDWRGAADAWREIGCPYEVALALLDGDDEAVREAITIFDSLGANPAASLARARLRDLGAASVPRGPSRHTRANPAGLTNRQLEVLQLIADGLTNTEIADQLYLSKKTVEHHVSAIYAKLGIDSRTKAVKEAEALGVVEREAYPLK